MDGSGCLSHEGARERPSGVQFDGARLQSPARPQPPRGPHHDRSRWSRVRPARLGPSTGDDLQLRGAQNTLSSRSSAMSEPRRVYAARASLQAEFSHGLQDLCRRRRVNFPKGFHSRARSRCSCGHVPTRTNRARYRCAPQGRKAVHTRDRFTRQCRPSSYPLRAP